MDYTSRTPEDLRGRDRRPERKNKRARAVGKGQAACRDALRAREERIQRLAENGPGVVYQFLMSPDGSFLLSLYQQEPVEHHGPLTGRPDCAMPPSFLTGCTPMTGPGSGRKIWIGPVPHALHSTFRLLKEAGHICWRPAPHRNAWKTGASSGTVFSSTSRSARRSRKHSSDAVRDGSRLGQHPLDQRRGPHCLCQDRASEWSGFTQEEL